MKMLQTFKNSAAMILTLALMSGLLSACNGESISTSAADSEQTTSDQDTSSNDNGIAYTTDSTDGVLCSYYYNEYNDSESVSATSYADWTCDGTNRKLT